MTRLLMWLLGRLPIGWLQLQHNRTRLVAAVGGVTFANVLIFMQLGFMGALFESSVKAHRTWNADIIVASSDFRALREANPVPRVRMFQALSVPGVVDACPVSLAPMTWTDPETGDTTSFRVMGVEPEKPVFRDQRIQSQLHLLSQADTALLDSASRQLNPHVLEAVRSGRPVRMEYAGRQVDLVGLFPLGASFADDGALIVSVETFLRLFPQRLPGTPTVILVRCQPGSDLTRIARAISAGFPEGDARAWTKEEFIRAEQNYQSQQTPVGFVFTFGVVIGLIVGIVIVYQVLTTDVQDHLAEYATFKAIGYSQSYFLGIIFEEAVALATLGFIPGMGISLILYRVAATVTALPMSMSWTRPLLVFGFTLAMCIVSGALATRRLATADPADLF